MQQITVIICTHNPRVDYIRATIDSIYQQNIASDLWNLIVVDNISSPSVYSKLDIQYRSKITIIQAPALGLTNARITGIQANTNPLVIFVDDDNILKADYFEKALDISKRFPFLGAWGGQVVPRFANPPAPWTKPHWSLLALCEFERDSWSNSIDSLHLVPYGAGLCVRRHVAEHYAHHVSMDPRRAGLDRRGTQLAAHGDTDLALTSCDLGLGTGRFTSLQLEHMIPSERLELSYLVRLSEAMSCSDLLLRSLRGRVKIHRLSILRKLLGMIKRRLTMHREDRLLAEARLRGRLKAYEILNHQDQNVPV
jgi:glycosyltransferase involved in cell wall biosynthesis